MKKIKSLFKRNYEGNRQVYDCVVEGSEWVVNGEGSATSPEQVSNTLLMLNNDLCFVYSVGRIVVLTLLKFFLKLFHTRLGFG